MQMIDRVKSFGIDQSLCEHYFAIDSIDDVKRKLNETLNELTLLEHRLVYVFMSSERRTITEQKREALGARTKVLMDLIESFEKGSF